MRTNEASLLRGEYRRRALAATVAVVGFAVVLIAVWILFTAQTIKKTRLASPVGVPDTLNFDGLQGLQNKLDEVLRLERVRQTFEQGLKKPNAP